MPDTLLDARLDVRPPWSATLLTGAAGEGELLSTRMRQDYLVRTWGRVWPAERWTEHFVRAAAGGTNRPFLVRYEDRLFAYVEVYLLTDSVLAPHGDWGAHDLGFHIAVIDPALTRRGLGTRFVQDLTAALFRQSPATSQIVTEPDIANTSICKTLERSDFRLVRPVRLADKTAALMRCPRPASGGMPAGTGP
ncbi:GNAT family N-acetyltransferase [uncultured Streptomyces sp.]|uniref:GNAT family N-acetyltransferase n=1 Tax=uncultured Streptomyces sp. TaxID=174707 RepID=UPI0026022C0C|nr:GNAT family N-acetyltransferase [uncultured Streptomyces sp.]